MLFTVIMPLQAVDKLVLTLYQGQWSLYIVDTILLLSARKPSTNVSYSSPNTQKIQVPALLKLLPKLVETSGLRDLAPVVEELPNIENGRHSRSNMITTHVGGEKCCPLASTIDIVERASSALKKDLMEGLDAQIWLPQNCPAVTCYYQMDGDLVTGKFGSPHEISLSSCGYFHIDDFLQC
ncbi:hypothetical protein SADUNF_Sadunf10G0065700 [Salix dunnii]|uniref:Uncharacterized protein n=1 Tax=Salix dunnii TaxID=1413687 RepID=A0A835JV97_9ROSI|nr:hypothetical protein SADUNF_Sadunf10G0065700 [Salix dunnii]